MKPFFPTFIGIRIVASIYAVKRVQFRFPRTKKRRINVKWAKQDSNWRNLPMAFIAATDPSTIICHPSLADKFRREFQ